MHFVKSIFWCLLGRLNQLGGKTMRYLSLLTVFILSSVFGIANAQYFDYDPDDPRQNAPLTPGERAIIPLDTEDPAYNLWQTPRDNLSEGREAGPINIQRFHGGAAGKSEGGGGDAAGDPRAGGPRERFGEGRGSGAEAGGDEAEQGG